MNITLAGSECSCMRNSIIYSTLNHKKGRADIPLKFAAVTSPTIKPIILNVFETKYNYQQYTPPDSSHNILIFLEVMKEI